jgi:Zn-dependent membrane protease YugP
MGFLYLDQYYIILVVPMLILSLIAQARIKSNYKKFSKIANSKGITGAMAAQRVLDYYGVNDVRIEGVAGQLTDHFDPRTKVIRLSEGVVNNASISAVGIACHEAGHAAQHAEGYTPIRIRNTILPICNIGSNLGLPLAILGYFLGLRPLISIGLLLYALIVVFQLITLPVEFNASRRAIKVIEETGMLTDGENNGAKAVLRSAAMTYVAAAGVAAANLLRLILRMRRR